MHVEVITPDKKIFDGEAEFVKLPGSEGSFGVLNNHAPMISTLGKGEIKIRENAQKTTTFSIEGGVAEVLNNHISILAEKILK